MVSPDLIKEFQAALKEEYGKDVTLKEASEILSDLVGYFDTLGRVNYKMQIRQ